MLGKGPEKGVVYHVGPQPKPGHPEPARPHDLGQGHPLLHESASRRPEPHGLRSLEPGEETKVLELRPIAEQLITALESSDRELKIRAVIGVLGRFELKKAHVEPRPEYPKPPVDHVGHPEPPTPSRPV